MTLLKPYLLFGSVAFTIGFVGYWAFSGVAVPASPPQDDWQATISAPLPDDGNPLRQT